MTRSILNKNQRGIKREMPARRVVATAQDKFSVGTHPKHGADRSDNRVGRNVLREGNKC